MQLIIPRSGCCTPISAYTTQERPSKGLCCYSVNLHKMTNYKSITTPDVISVKYYIIGHSCHLCFIDFPSACVFVIDGEFYYYKVTSGNLPLIRHNYQKIQHDQVDLSFIWRLCSVSANARTFLCVDIRSNSTTPLRVALARMFKEAGLRSPRTQLTKVQIKISVRGRRTEASYFHVK